MTVRALCLCMYNIDDRSLITYNMTLTICNCNTALVSHQPHVCLDGKVQHLLCISWTHMHNCIWWWTHQGIVTLSLSVVCILTLTWAHVSRPDSLITPPAPPAPGYFDLNLSAGISSPIGQFQVWLELSANQSCCRVSTEGEKFENEKLQRCKLDLIAIPISAELFRYQN